MEGKLVFLLAFYCFNVSFCVDDSSRNNKGCSPDSKYEEKLSNPITERVIATPGYEKEETYLDKLKCDWTFTADSGKRLGFTLLAIDTLYGYDEIFVYDEVGKHAKILLRYSGTRLLNRQFNSSSNYMHIKFKKDNTDKQWKGFKAKVMVLPDEALRDANKKMSDERDTNRKIAGLTK